MLLLRRGTATEGNVATAANRVAAHVRLGFNQNDRETCFARRDPSGYYRINARIHSAINDAAKNPVLASTYRAINARVQSLRFRTNQDEAKWKQAVAEHERMIEALGARDATAMREVLVEHLNRKRDTVLALLRAGEIYPAAQAGKR